MKAVVLVAGYATRLYPLTKNRAKALLMLGNRCILDYILDQIIQIPDLSEVILISNANFFDSFADWSKTRGDCPVPIRVLNDGTHDDDSKRGAVGDLAFAISEAGIDEDILVIAGDNLFTYRLADVYAAYRASGRRNLILGQKLPEGEDIHRFAVAELDEEKRVLSLEEKPENPKSDMIVYATYFYGAETLPLVRQYLDEGGNPDAPGFFPAWLHKRRPVYLYAFEGSCIDIGTHASYDRIKALVEKEPAYLKRFSGRAER